MTGKIMTDNDYVKNPIGTAVGPYVASSLAPSSGLITNALSALAGPWYIERQHLNVQYLRVPAGGLGASSTSISLTGATTVHAPMDKTTIVALVTASYQAFVDYASYGTSSYQQTQKFQVNSASADPYGVSYGTVNASSMGPMGSIITAQPWVRRTPYTGASSQPLVQKYINGATFPMQEMDPVTHLLGNSVLVNNYWTDYKVWKDGGCQPGTHRLGSLGPVSYFNNNDYVIWGGYNISKESWYDMTSYIDAIGSRISGLQIFENPATTGVLVGHTIPVADLGIAEYNVSHHEY